MEGWIKLHRRLLSWEWYTDSKTVHLFVHLLLKANHKANKWRGHAVDRGQVITGLPALSDATGLTIRNTRTCLKRLVDSGAIDRQSDSQFSVITICNYDTYQDDSHDSDRQSDSQVTGKRQTDGRQATTNNNEKTLKNVKKRVRFTPPSPIEVEKYCTSRNNNIDPKRFHDYYSSIGWKRGKVSIVDWKAVVRTWEEDPKQSETQTKRKDSNTW